MGTDNATQNLIRSKKKEKGQLSPGGNNAMKRDLGGKFVTNSEKRYYSDEGQVLQAGT